MTENSNEPKKQFIPRWQIRGMLYTLSPLHIGSGETTTHPELEQDNGKKTEISAVAVDHQEQACIPGSTLKGCLRSWLNERARKEQIENVFGRDAVEQDMGIGGRAEFHDALIQVKKSGDPPLPCWNPERQTFVEAGNSINRETGTAADDHLFHQENVPPGVGFLVSVTGRMERGQVEFLLAALEGFNALDPVQLGADTADGKGRFCWECGTVCCMEKETILEWIANPNCPMPESAMKEISISAASLPAPGRQPFLPFDITLLFQGPFLVNDPPGKTVRMKKADDKTRPTLLARKDDMGRTLLPSGSFRGAFRAQAEKILRTMATTMNGTTPSNEQYRRVACRPEIHDLGCKPIIDQKDRKNLCLACQVFGAPGWRTVLEVSDFTKIEGTGEPVVQEFVAIDRFTGGGVDKMKFNAGADQCPHFSGCLSLDRERLQGEWPLGLLALVLRDLKEGDITFGYGAAKGYGQCTAEIEPWMGKTFQESAIKGLEDLKGIITNLLQGETV